MADEPIARVHVALDLQRRCFRVTATGHNGNAVIKAEHESLEDTVAAVLAALVVAVKDHEGIVVQAEQDQLAHVMDELAPRRHWLQSLSAAHPEQEEAHG